ncbi:MAG: hypothetical protein AB7O96_04990 [Pseudobdellovibrionaceae bacterium]
MLIRLRLSLTGFSIGIFFIAWQMTESHLAHPKNPAWQVVSGLRTILLVLWIAGGVLYAMLFIFEAIARRRARQEAIKLQQLEDERMERERVANAKIYKKEEQERKKVEAKKLTELTEKQKHEDERRDQARQARQARIEKMKSRSPDEATNEALKDFF